MGLGHHDEEERENSDLILTPARQEALELWKGDYWAFLTGVDPDTNEPIIRTVDQRDKANPIKPFPGHLRGLRYLCDLIASEPFMFGEKSSQVMFSTTVLLMDLWNCWSKLGWKVLLSKHSEEEAEILLDEKVRTPISLMPLWLQRQMGASKKPKNTVFFKKPEDVDSLILGLPENAAAAKARGQTYQAGRIDEAEFQDMLRALITAMLPRCGQLLIWSTPAIGGEGARIFSEYLADDPIRLHPHLVELRKKYVDVRGMTIRRNNERDCTIVRMHYSYDPSKTKAWAEEGRRRHVSRVDWDREMEIKRTSSAGRPFYPQFLENPRRYIAKCREIPIGTPIIRGWDFGGANPACIWGAWSSRSKRFWVLRELLGYSIDTYQFRDLVKYLSGQLSLETLRQHPRAMEMLEELAGERAYPKMPWFEGPNRFLDFAGHEGFMGPRGLVAEKDRKTAIEILELGDIHLYARQVKHSSRTDILNGLSRLRDCDIPEHKGCDGHPGFYLDPACIILIRGLSSGIVYAKSTAQNPDPTEPAKDAVYSHLHDALGYAITNVVSLEDANYFQASLGPDGKILMPENEDAQLMSYLSQGFASL